MTCRFVSCAWVLQSVRLPTVRPWVVHGGTCPSRPRADSGAVPEGGWHMLTMHGRHATRPGQTGQPGVSQQALAWWPCGAHPLSSSCISSNVHTVPPQLPLPWRHPPPGHPQVVQPGLSSRSSALQCPPRAPWMDGLLSRCSLGPMGTRPQVGLAGGQGVSLWAQQHPC